MIITAVELDELLLVLLHTLLEGCQIVVDHHPIDNELLFGLELEDAGHSKVKSETLHQALNDVKDDLDQVDLVDKDAFHLCAVYKSEELVACELASILFENSIVLLESRWEALKELFIYLLKFLERYVLKR